MATIAENIQTLRSIKSDIKQAITDKGGSVGNDFKTYAQAITNLPSGGGGGTEMEDALVMRTLSEYSNDRVSRVGDYAFAHYLALTSISLPNCLQVGASAFYYCKLLSNFNLPLCEYVNIWAFAGCNSLISISLSNCSYINDYAFWVCSALSIVKLPNCSYFGKSLFYSCTKLVQVYLNSVSSVTTIYSNTFYNCPKLTSIYVPASLVNAFKTAQYWSSISDKIVAYTEPTEPNKLVYSAKSSGSTITVNGQSVTLEQGDNITLDYPNEITSVEATGNVELTYLQIPNTVTSINDNAFGDCDALTSITLPDSVKSIGVQAFQACIGLTSINIPSGVTSISMETFNACSALTSVTLPEGLTNIGSSTFMDCTSLTSITIPSTVTMIDFEAFNYCEALTDFNFNGTMAQWASITKGDDWNLNAAFTVVHCTDGDVNIL